MLTRVVSIDPIWFSFEGAESFYLKYLRQDRAGERGRRALRRNPVEIQLADESDYRWHGRMEFVDNAIDPNSGTIRAHAVIANPDGFLTPGMFGRARLLGSGTYHAMLVPDEAIVTDQTRKLVYVVGKDGKVAPRPVETGPQVEGLRVIKTGLAPDRAGGDRRHHDAAARHAGQGQPGEDASRARPNTSPAVDARHRAAGVRSDDEVTP